MRPIFIALACFVVGCADGDVTVRRAPSGAEVANYTVVPITAQNIAKFAADPARSVPATLLAVSAGEYRVGPGDSLGVYVLDHPELALPDGAGNSGFLVRSDGMFTYPFIGEVKAAGRTVPEIRVEMVKRLTAFFPNPEIDLRMSDYKSQRVVLGGAIASPGVATLDGRPLTLFDAVTAAGGLGDDADAAQISLRRAGREYRIDLDGYLTDGLAANNPQLLAGDVIFVPQREMREAYVLGEIGQPSTIDLSRDTITLTQAIARKGGLDRLRADARGVFVFRAVDGARMVYQLDVSVPSGLVLGTRFTLMQNDVVYITRSPLQKWNDTISRILPSVSAASTGVSASEKVGL